MNTLKAAVAILSITALGACAGTPETMNSQANDMSYSEKGWAYDDVVNKDWAKAEAILSDEVKAHPDDPFRLLNLAYVYTQADKPDDAVAVYERVLDLDENPVATLLTGEDVRAKTIAEDALASIIVE